MATSGSTDFAITRTSIINGAFRRINVLARGETADASQLNNGIEALNLMVKEWQADGLNLWAVDKAELWLTVGQRAYVLSSSSSDKASSGVVKTEVSSAGAASDTTLEVDSTTDMAAADAIGVLQDDGTIHWTTIASITDSDTLVLTAGLASAASVDNNVYTYTTLLPRPMRIVSARRITVDDIYIPVETLSIQEYDDLSNKLSPGTVNSVWYDRELTQGTLYIYLVPTDERDRLELTIQRPLEDFDNATDNPDFPIEWGNALIWNLAADLAVEYGRSAEILQRAIGRGVVAKERVMSLDREDTSIFFQPDEEGSY